MSSCSLYDDGVVLAVGPAGIDPAEAEAEFGGVVAYGGGGVVVDADGHLLPLSECQHLLAE